MDANSIQPVQEPQAELAQDYVEVEFRADALVKFNEVFASREQCSVLALLVEHADEGIEVAKQTEIPIRLLTLFRIRFRYLDLRDAGKLIVLSLENSNNDSPPPNNKKWQDPFIAGGVAGLIRWVLGHVIGRLRSQPRIATINGKAVPKGPVYNIRSSDRTLGVRF